MSLAEDILSFNDVLNNLKKVEIPEWKQTIYIKYSTIKEACEMRSYMKSLNKDELNLEEILPFYIKYICDENGNQLFTEKDIPILTNKSSSSMLRIVNAINEHNNITDIDKEKK